MRSETRLESTRVCLRPDWDAAITYDVLDTPAKPRGVFVGREDLLRPLEAAVVEADKRGTILVSGYRGSGKTTLVIEALRRAALEFTKLPEGARPRLLPVVLNVSEVATSLAAPEVEAKLQIDPRRLLIALLRAFRQRVESFPKSDALRERIQHLYHKATAAAFRLAQASGESRSSVQQRELGLKLEATDLLKGSLFPAGLISLGLASLGAADGVVDQVVKGVAASGAIGAATVGLWLNRTRTDKATATREVAITFEHDNSQQELENDLKDLLQQLRNAGWRTVVVLEELDKLGGEGEELDGVIRYFKNLFTQAPALFLFVTDKAYYDRISRNIRHARRERSYAIEHTFFTHRVFVGRPSTRDCLQFIRALLPQSADQEVLDRIYAGGGRWATESFGSRNTSPVTTVTPLSLLVRVLLFRASNHLFDLKAELQRFVRNGAAGPELCFGPEMFPPEDQVLAKFQDLLADKTRTFEIKGGRGYANEVLHDCLAGVFHDLGSARQRLESELLVGDAPNGQEGPLEPGERRRVNEAVSSLLDDLARGGALRRLAPGTATAAIEWLDRPAEAFSLVRRLDEHEEKFVGELRRFASLADQLADFAPDHPLATAARKSAAEFAERAEAVSDLDTKVSVDEVLKSAREAGETLRRLVAQANEAVSQAAAALHGLAFESLPVGSREPGDGARLLVTADGDPRSITHSGLGLVVLAEGDRESMFADVRSLVERARPQRVAIVCLVAGFTADEAGRWRDKWIESLAGLTAWEEGSQLRPRVGVLARDQLGSLAPDAATNPDPAANPAPLLLARELLAAAIWAVRPRPAPGASPQDATHLAPAIKGWLDLAPEPTLGRTPVLVTQALPFPRLAAAVAEALWRGCPDATWCLPLPDLAKTGTLNSEASQSSLGVHLESLLGPTSIVPGAREQRARRIIDLLTSETGIVVTDIAPPREANVLFGALRGHRWAMPDDGQVLRRVKQRGMQELKLDVVDSRAPPGSTTHVPVIWGIYQGETVRAPATPAA